MDNTILEANLKALSGKNLDIYTYLISVKSNKNIPRFSFNRSKSGELIPFYNQPDGSLKPLHSTIDPVREAKRINSEVTEDTGFIIFLGLGGGFAPKEALDNSKARILVIDFHIEEIADLFFEKDYSALLINDRFTLMIDASEKEIKNFITENYRPVLDGGIKTIPLRTRTDMDLSLFSKAAAAIEEAVNIVSGDFSVQSHFGKRWFSNIVRNLGYSRSINENKFLKNVKSNIKEAAIIAAGPSLDRQLDTLYKYKKKNVFLICCDTAFPVLFHHGIEPDAVVSIDCQHISYYHFISVKLSNIFLILDIASPRLLSSFSKAPCYFSSGHPLALLASQNIANIPQLDTSGGNVAYACLSFAQYIGAEHITLFGADFSYTGSQSYARGTYISPFFEKKQNRFAPAQALFSSFLYRSPFVNKGYSSGGGVYYETASLNFYRKKFEEKAGALNAKVKIIEGQGAPVTIIKKPETIPVKSETQNGNMNGLEFLKKYCKEIKELPHFDNANMYLKILNSEQRQIFYTLLPFAAAVKRRSPLLKTKDVIKETKSRCIEEIEKALNQSSM